MKSVDISKSKKRELILHGRLARVVFQKFAPLPCVAPGRVAPLEFNESNRSQLPEILTAELTCMHILRLRCLLALFDGHRLDDVISEFKVSHLFVASLVGMFTRDGLKSAVLNQPCPKGIANMRKVYIDTIKIVSSQPLPAGFRWWNREALAYAVKIHLQLEIRPSLSVITELLQEMNFVKWKGSFISRSDKNIC